MRCLFTAIVLAVLIHGFPGSGNAQVALTSAIAVVPFEGGAETEFGIIGTGFAPRTRLDEYFIAPGGTKFSYLVEGQQYNVETGADGTLESYVAPKRDLRVTTEGTWQVVFCVHDSDDCVGSQFVVGGSPPRKGVANPEVAVDAYTNELRADWMFIGSSWTAMGSIFSQPARTKDEFRQQVEALQNEAATMDAVYRRQVARDYPPSLRDLDAYYSETVRSINNLHKILLKATQTSDPLVLDQLDPELRRFESFSNGFMLRLQ